LGRLSAWIETVVRNSTTRAVEGDIPGIQDRPVWRRVTTSDWPTGGLTALLFAAQQSQTEAVRALLAAGASVDPQDRFGNTPLWRAVFNARGDATTVGLLLRAGADPDIVNEAGATPRDLAIRMGADEIAALFPDMH
jgi:uncharacterized protein